MPERGDGMCGEPFPGKAEQESTVQKEERIIKTFGNRFRHSSGNDAMVPGHSSGNSCSDGCSNAQPDEVSFCQPGCRKDIFNPIANQEIKGRFRYGKQRIQKIVHFSGPFKAQEGDDRNTSDEEQIQCNEVQEKLVAHDTDQFSPDREHKQKGNIDIQEIIGGGQIMGIQQGEEFGNMSFNR